MTIRVNFISKEYSSKLMTEKIIVLAGFLVILVLGSVGAGYLVLDKLINDKIAEINATKLKIQGVEAEIAAIQLKRKQIPDLTSKIDMLKDLFAQSNLKFSEILFSLMQNTPAGLWYTNFDYKDKKIVLRGAGTNEMLVYSLERNLKDTGFYSSVALDHIRDQMIQNNTVKEFQYDNVLKPLNILPTAPVLTTSAIIATTPTTNANQTVKQGGVSK